MEQIERANRYLERIRKIYRGVERPYHSINGFEDDVVSFFIHCHHIADWVAQLNCKGISLENVNQFINSHEELKVCADFCNGSKHCRLERKRTQSQPHMISKSYWSTDIASIPHVNKPGIERAVFKIASHNASYDALELAERCMELWGEYVDSIKDTDTTIRCPPAS